MICIKTLSTRIKVFYGINFLNRITIKGHPAFVALCLIISQKGSKIWWHTGVQLQDWFAIIMVNVSAEVWLGGFVFRASGVPRERVQVRFRGSEGNADLWKPFGFTFLPLVTDQPMQDFMTCQSA